MLADFKQKLSFWASDVKSLVKEQFSELDPQEYCVGAIIVVVIGFVLLKRQ